MTHLILSLDYEVFGNGAGDVRRDVVYPTRRLLDICEKHGARMTIMCEVGEYLAFQRYDDRLRQELGYSPCQAMQVQMTEAIERGHDVQLHLHPQWIGAEYDGGVWRLCDDCWRLADLPGGLGNEEQPTSIIGALYRGKQTLEDMLKPVQVDYECTCFRAGGFYAQPSRDIIQAMKRVGLRADSSVIKGYRTARPFAVDYSGVATGAPAWWTTETELTEEGTPGRNILELPVSSRMERYWNSFKPVKLRAALHRRQIERAHQNHHTNNSGISSVPSGRAVLTKMLTRYASTFDFCKLSCRDMIRRMEGVIDGPEQPVVVIGHAKDFVNDRQLDRFLAWLSGNRTVRSVTFSEYIRRNIDNL